MYESSPQKMFDGLADSAESLLSNKAEWHTFLMGLSFGTVIALLWEDHRDVALTLLAVTTALSLMQFGLMWRVDSYQTRLIEAQPWYFYTPVAIGLLVRAAYNKWKNNNGK